jgi:hypothetical protein
MPQTSSYQFLAHFERFIKVNLPDISAAQACVTPVNVSSPAKISNLGKRSRSGHGRFRRCVHALFTRMRNSVAVANARNTRVKTSPETRHLENMKAGEFQPTSLGMSDLDWE